MLYGIEGALRVSTCLDKGKYFHMYRFRGGHPDMAASDQYARYTNTGKARKEMRARAFRMHFPKEALLAKVAPYVKELEQLVHDNKDTFEKLVGNIRSLISNRALEEGPIRAKHVEVKPLTPQDMAGGFSPRVLRPLLMMRRSVYPQSMMRLLPPRCRELNGR